MSLIQVRDLSFAYEGSSDKVFEAISFQIDSDWKLGLTGRNGRGKTTLLKLLRGDYPYEGSIRASVAFQYFPDPVLHPDWLCQKVLEEIDPTLRRRADQAAPGASLSAGGQFPADRRTY